MFDFLRINRQQLYTLFKALVVAGGPLTLILSAMKVDNATTKSIMDICGVLVSMGGTIMLMADKTDRKMAVDASEVKGVQVHVDTSTADPAVVSAAIDPNVTDVRPMIGGPRVD